jgi:carotenoid cleavage dioxygenase
MPRAKACPAPSATRASPTRASSSSARPIANTNLPPYAWEPDKGTHVALVPRRGSVDQVRWFSADPCYVFHPMNAFDTPDGKVVCDMMKYPVAPLFPRPDGRAGHR